MIRPTDLLSVPSAGLEDVPRRRLSRRSGKLELEASKRRGGVFRVERT